MKKISFINIKSIIQLVAIMLLVFVGGRLLHDIVVTQQYNAGEEITTFALSSLMTLMVMVIMVIVNGPITYENRFNMVIAMGQTRKSFFIESSIQVVIYTIVGELFAIVLMRLDDWLNATRFPYIECEITMGTYIAPKYMLASFLLMLVAFYLIASLICWFGRAGYVVVWVIYMLIVVAPASNRALLHGGANNVLVKVIKVCMTYYKPILLTALVLAAFLCYQATRKKAVRT